MNNPASEEKPDSADDRCCICYDVLEAKEIAYFNCCTHYVCASCAINLVANYKNTCPLDRSEIEQIFVCNKVGGPRLRTIQVIRRLFYVNDFCTFISQLPASHHIFCANIDCPIFAPYLLKEMCRYHSHVLNMLKNPDIIVIEYVDIDNISIPLNLVEASLTQTQRRIESVLDRQSEEDKSTVMAIVDKMIVRCFFQSKRYAKDTQKYNSPSDRFGRLTDFIRDFF